MLLERASVWYANGRSLVVAWLATIDYVIILSMTCLRQEHLVDCVFDIHSVRRRELKTKLCGHQFVLLCCKSLGLRFVADFLFRNRYLLVCIFVCGNVFRQKYVFLLCQKCEQYHRNACAERWKL